MTIANGAFALYNERNTNFLAREDHETTWLQFCKGRNELFAHHPQSALDNTQRHTFTELPYNPTLRFTVDINSASEPIKQAVVMTMMPGSAHSHPWGTD